MQPTRQSRRRAFTLVEVILSLVILAILMAALGAAFQGSTNSYAASEGLTEMINTARQALLRITADIRTAQDGSVALIDGGIHGDIDNHQCSLFRADGSHVTYHYNTSTAASYNTALDDQTLYLIINSGASAGTYRLCDHVLDMTFERGTDGVNVRNVRIGMTLTDDTGQPPQTLHTAAVVRTLP